MKILLFVSGLGAGGKERRLTELMKELKSHPEIDFELAIMSHDIHYSDVFNLDIKIHYLLRKAKKDLSIVYKFYKLCKEIKPDIVHCWDSMTAVYCAFVCKILQISLVNGMITDAQNQNSFFNENRIRANLTFPFSDVIVGNSKAGLSAYSAPSKKSVVIYNGFNFNRIQNLIPIEQVREELNINTIHVVGMVATYSGYKDYKTYYAAAQILLDRGYDVTFLAIGDNTNSSQSRDLISNKYLPNFRLLGKKSGVESFINIMEVCVLATFTEGISNSILEYMALGKPVVATDGGGTKELIDDNKTGFLVKLSNPEDLAEKIEYLLNDSDLCNRIGKCGNVRVKNMFSIDLMVNKYIALYNHSTKKPANA